MQILISHKQKTWGFYLLGSLIICFQDFADARSALLLFKLIAPALVILGFLSLAGEVGRPSRFYHVFRNLTTSWISRETLIAIFFVFISSKPTVIMDYGSHWSRSAND